MKPIGAIRRIDNVGRFTIPKKVMRTLNIHIGDDVEIWLGQNNTIIIQKLKNERCVFCNESKNLLAQKIDGKTICQTCFQLFGASTEI